MSIFPAYVATQVQTNRRRFTMANYTSKKLPPLLEQADLSERGIHHPIANRRLVLPGQFAKSQDTANALRRQVSQLQEQNAGLCRSLHEADSQNTALRQQLSAYRQYIKRQDDGLAHVIKHHLLCVPGLSRDCGGGHLGRNCGGRRRAKRDERRRGSVSSAILASLGMIISPV